jgi:hypothetical protein
MQEGVNTACQSMTALRLSNVLVDVMQKRRIMMTVLAR